VQAVLDRYGIFFIDDEVICGFGRTGNPFGCQTLGIRPTTMSIAKAVSSAYLPLSAVIIPEFLYEPMIEASGQVGTFGHGFTYSGHPVCAAVALRNLELMEERDLFAHAARMSKPFQARLRALADHPLVGEARGVGLIGAIELVANKETKAPYPSTQGVAAYCSGRNEENGLIARNIGETIAFCPPLIISENQIHELFDKFSRSLDQTLEWVRRG
jgi:4-aminobutyrate--pyruvate transaminase